MKIQNKRIITIICVILIFFMDISGGFAHVKGSDNQADGTFTEAGGYIFLPEDYYTPAVNVETELMAYGSGLEEKYVTENIPAIRNQNPYGTCWAFSSISLAEIGILNREGISADLSELHLAYFTYDSTKDPIGGLNDDNKYIGSTSYLNKGGNYILAYHTLANWKGASKEETVPYSNAADSVNNGINTSLAFDSVAHLRNVYKININENRDDVKKMIKEYGAVGVSYKDYYAFYNYEHNSYYASDYSGYGHAVSVVGWDDNFPKENFNSEAPGDGAWLIRNSWGTDAYCRDGYFWMSYYSKSLVDVAYVFDFVSSSSDEYYDNNYQYDGTIYSSVFKINRGGKIANVFTVQNELEALEAVSFETESVNVEYEVNIYKNVEDGNPESGTLVSTATGNTVYAGMYNVKLDTPVFLQKDDRYSVVITLHSSEATVKYLADGQWTEKNWFSTTSVGNPGESYYKYPMAGWNDFGASLGKNIRIKAYTNTIDVEIDEITYTGEELTPNVTLKHKGIILSTDDYEIEYFDNIKAGSKAYVIITGKGMFTGSVKKYFTISPINLSRSGITTEEIPDKKYTGTAFEPEVLVKDGIKELIKNTDYTLSYSNNINAGTATVVIKGKGNYTGEKKISFKITKVDITDNNVVTLEKMPDVQYTGSAAIPQPVFKHGNRELISGTDYDVSCDDIEIGTATAIINGKGNYTGEKKVGFRIVEADMANNSSIMVEEIPEMIYTGNEIKPEITITHGSRKLVLDTDYILEYINNTEIGTATVKIKGMGKYTGEREVYFRICVDTFTDNAKIIIEEIPEQTYTGNTISPEVTVKNGTRKLMYKEDFTLEYENNINTGTATVVIRGINNYTGEKRVTFKIIPMAVTDERKITTEVIAEHTYTGNVITPKVTVKHSTRELVNGTDYILTYVDNINAGTATAVIKGTGNYTGEKRVTFIIKPLTFTGNGSVTVGAVENHTYTGNAITPEITVKYDNQSLVKDKDYTISYVNNINAGTATVVIKGSGNFTGEKRLNFLISPISFTNNSTITVGAIEDYTYTGNAITPEITVKCDNLSLVKDKDYTTSYMNNTNVGTATVVIQGINNYTGESMVNFIINERIPDIITSDVFSINQQTLTASKISQGCTSGSLLSALNEKKYCVMMNGSEKLPDSSPLGTGMILNLMNESEIIKSYRVVVTGDVNGDGKINITDMIAVKQDILGKSKLSGLRKSAGDVNGDGKINITDFIKIKASILGKDKITGITSK